MELFDETESGYTATAGSITLAGGEKVDFTKWGNPERSKINAALAVANLYQWRRRGVY
jgi:hypothetical protein